MTSPLDTDTDLVALASHIEELYEKPTSDLTEEDAATVAHVIDLLDDGVIRVAAPTTPGAPWQVNEWAKKAVLLTFRTRGMETIECGPYEYHDKLLLKTGYAARGVRVVPPATARHGSYLAPGVVLMPSYVNIGAWVGENTMVDTWATVGSCAQVGADVHLSGGVGIGGVLEPLQAAPVIVEDGAFVGLALHRRRGRAGRRPRRAGGERRPHRHDADHRHARQGEGRDARRGARRARSSCLARARRSSRPARRACPAPTSSASARPGPTSRRR